MPSEGTFGYGRDDGFGEREDSQGGWPLQAIVARGLGEGRLDAGSSSRELEATAAWGLSELGLRLDGAGRAGSWRGQVKVGGYAMPFSGSSPGPQSTAVLDERVDVPQGHDNLGSDIGGRVEVRFLPDVRSRGKVVDRTANR